MQERFNVVPGKAQITGMNRTFTADTRKKLPGLTEKMIKKVFAKLMDVNMNLNMILFVVNN